MPTNATWNDLLPGETERKKCRRAGGGACMEMPGRVGQHSCHTVWCGYHPRTAAERTPLRSARAGKSATWEPRTAFTFPRAEPPVVRPKRRFVEPRWRTSGRRGCFTWQVGYVSPISLNTKRPERRKGWDFTVAVPMERSASASGRFRKWQPSRGLGIGDVSGTVRPKTARPVPVR